ncbi:zinc finger MYM-type protein 1-like [Aquarana catesbeiana]|uniref:zinc finger MYM-type protein 1-like n=1 Tax=Aquarana catesbeiana TaxID=8400 RepID=UPI003CCA371C
MDIRKFFLTKVSAAESSPSVQSQQEEESLTSGSEQIIDFDDDPLDAEEGSRSSCLESSEELPERAGSSSVNLSLVCEATDLGDVEKGPVQPKLAQYPYEYFGTQKRSFQFHWLEKYSWLEYSIQKNASFCFSCRNFGTKQGRSHLDSLMCKSGYKNWKRALDSFKEHDKSSAHKSGMLSWSAYKDSILRGNVLEKIQTGREVQIQERRDYLKRLVAVATFLSKQGISFRGHDESENSQNRGNFKECLNLISKFDTFLKNYSPPANSTYTSPLSQNAIIQCCSEEVSSKIVNELKASGLYSVMADEARDHQKEQLAVFIRYVLPENGEIKEHFLSLKELKDFCADSITESLQECLKDYGLDSLLCVAQTYDGAAVMSGVSGGVQAKFQKYHPEAIYVHCYAHELNLVLCHTCKAIKEAKDFFNTMENLYTFFSTSLIHHQKFKDAQSTLGLKPGELVQLSDTRWSCQIRSVNALITNFVPVCKCLSEIKSSTASGLLSNLKKISVIFLSLCSKLY